MRTVKVGCVCVCVCTINSSYSFSPQVLTDACIVHRAGFYTAEIVPSLEVFIQNKSSGIVDGS